MPRRSSAARQNDQKIHEAFVSGLSEAQVAAKFHLAVEQVVAAAARVECEREALAPDEAARHAQFETHRAVVQLALRTFQHFFFEGEVTTKTSSGPDGQGRRAERIVRKKAPDPRYLRIAMDALAAECKLRRLDEPEAPAKSGKPVPAIDESLIRQALLKHPDYAAYQHSVREGHYGGALPHYDLNDARFDPPKPDKENAELEQ